MTLLSSTSKHRRSRLVVGLTSSAVLLAACSPAGGGAASGDGGGSKVLSFATGGTGGVYYPYGGGIATVIRENVKGVDATVQETNASVDNLLLIQNGSADLALSVGDVVADAVAGEGEFKAKPVDACALGNLYNNFTQTITTTGTGIKTVEDMVGKTISVGAPSSATEVVAKRILEAAGLDPKKDIKLRQLGVAETVDALRDGTIDAGFWSGGLPTGALVDLASTGKMVLVPTGKYAASMAKKYGDYYFEDQIPAGTYEGQKAASPQVAAPNILLVNKKMDKQLAYDITKAIFEHKDELIKVHPAAKALDPKTAGDITFIDTCPGAQDYYDEQG